MSKKVYVSLNYKRLAVISFQNEFVKGKYYILLIKKIRFSKLELGETFD